MASTFAAMPLLSANSTLRTILVLLILWQLLRLATRVRASRGPGGGPGPVRRRPKGDVRIEQVDPPKQPMERLHVEDADFEEIK